MTKAIMDIMKDNETTTNRPNVGAHGPTNQSMSHVINAPINVNINMEPKKVPIATISASALI